MAEAAAVVAKPRRTRIPAKLFVQVWQTCASLDEVIEKTGMTRLSAGTRARTLRKHGVPLQKFNRVAIAKTDLVALTELAKSLQK